MAAFSAEKAASLLTTLPQWEIKAGELVRIYKFEDFVTALEFVNQIAVLAEKAGHHPDIDIRYNKVRLALVTHDAGGLTSKYFDLAAQADKAV
jgi:4a-hydroxytetrahydrobiopterin dehydratase